MDKSLKQASIVVMAMTIAMTCLVYLHASSMGGIPDMLTVALYVTPVLFMVVIMLFLIPRILIDLRTGELYMVMLRNILKQLPADGESETAQDILSMIIAFARKDIARLHPLWKVEVPADARQLLLKKIQKEMNEERNRFYMQRLKPSEVLHTTGQDFISQGIALEQLEDLWSSVRADDASLPLPGSAFQQQGERQAAA